MFEFVKFKKKNNVNFHSVLQQKMIFEKIKSKIRVLV